MSQYLFLFSNALKWRLLRHFSFWGLWYLTQVYLYSFTPSPMLKLGFWSRIEINACESLFYMIPNLFFAYSLMYFVIPKLVVPGIYLKAALAVILLTILTGGVSAFISLTAIESFRQSYSGLYGNFGSTPVQTPLNVRLYLAWISGLRGSITIGGMAAAIKLVKYFFEKQQQTLLLEQQRTVAELQSLKAQLHPHFLFNTLNNIYSHTQDTAPVAAEMLHGLSSLLRYILYSCNAPLVSLQQEVAMMKEYIALEKKRYGNELEISLLTPADYHDAMIAPLLILPFIENCFKYGASEVLEQPWIKIQILLEDEMIKLKAVNGKVKRRPVSAGGIGIANVQKRLDLLYPNQYALQIVEEEEVYIVNLTIPMIRLSHSGGYSKSHELTGI